MPSGQPQRESQPLRPARGAGRFALLALCCASLVACAGCRTVWHRNRVLEETIDAATLVPHELAKTTLPTYRIEPPDVLLIDAVKVVPKEPYQIEPQDILSIIATGTLEEQPITGEYQVDASGSVNLGPGYGRVRVVGNTVREAQKAILKQLSSILTAPEVSVSLATPASRQAIAGEHIVRQDGVINLGIYGNVRVVGLTLMQAREAVEEHLSEYLEGPQIAVDVAAFNSKVYYIITQGAGQGDQIARVPIQGNETVLDAVSQLGGFTSNQSNHMWLARPAPDHCGPDQVLPVDWHAITQGGSTKTNYQILPGDRLFISEDKFVLADTIVQKVTGPFERIFGFSLLGVQTVQTINRSPSGFRGTGNINPFNVGGFF